MHASPAADTEHELAETLADIFAFILRQRARRAAQQAEGQATPELPEHAKVAAPSEGRHG